MGRLYKSTLILVICLVFLLAQNPVHADQIYVNTNSDNEVMLVLFSDSEMFAGRASIHGDFAKVPLVSIKDKDTRAGGNGTGDLSPIVIAGETSGNRAEILLYCNLADVLISKVDPVKGEQPVYAGIVKTNYCPKTE